MTRALALNPKYADAYFNRGTAKFAKEYEEAIKDYDKVLALNPKYADTYFNRGNAKSKLKKLRSD